MKMKHGIVYAEEGIYAGWPANHGAWQWGDEFLVGFLRGRYSKKEAMHAIAEPYEKVQARSLDGGETWTVEKPNVDFECEMPIREPMFRLQHGDIIRVCGVYDHGGERCYNGGGFYLSGDKGKKWNGPFAFRRLQQVFEENGICTARTAYLADRGMLFMSDDDANMWGMDSVFCVQQQGRQFTFLATVCQDDARAVCPSVTSLDGLIVVAMRRKQTGKRAGWIDTYCSQDEGRTWRFLSFVGSTGGHNGNPPALRALPDGRLCCVFGNRDEGSIICAMSDDRGKTWLNTAIRSNDIDNVDLGYPQLFVRTDGTPVCVYYWVDSTRREQHIAYTVMGR